MTRLVGIDLGGTWIRAALATGPAQHGVIIHRPTPAQAGPEAVLRVCAEAALEASGGETPDGIAIGIPGPLDPRTGVVYAAPHLAGWEGVNARDRLRETTGCEVAIANDANLAGFAEWTAGAGRGTSHFVFLTVSTGIGAALILRGILQLGAAGTAGEVGHSFTGLSGPRCGQGHRGCLEGIASGTAIAQRAQAALAEGVESRLRGHSHPSAADVQRAAEDGDELGVRLYSEAGAALGHVLGGLINVLSPEVIAIGGGLIAAGRLLFETMNSSIAEMAFEAPRARCRIVPAELGTDAGLVGAVAWAQQQHGHG